MPKEKIVIHFNNKNGILQCSPKILKLIREKFSVKNTNWRQRRFDPRKYAITPSGSFQIGIWEEIHGFISSLNIPVDLKFTDEFKNNYKPQIKYDSIEKIDNINYYDYQQEAIELFLQNGRGIAIIGTSGGKTPVMGGLCKTLLKLKPDAKILIMVPDIGLLNQTYYEFVYNFKIENITQWGDKKLPDLSKNIVISNTQMLLSDIKESVKRFHNFDYVIIDEAHTLGERKNQINKLLHNIKTPNRFGLTGTLPNNLMACWNIIGKIGPLLIEESSFSIRQKGKAAEVMVHCLICNLGPIPDIIGIDHSIPTDRYTNECQFIYTNKKRNDLIMNIAEKVNGNVLVIVDKLLHGDILSRYPSKKNVYFINGSMPTEERELIKAKMENSDDTIGVAMAQIFSRGISIKNIKYIIFCAIGKSNVRVCQAIGRVMRLHENKTIAYIFDISDLSEYSKEHFKERLGIYKKEKIPFEKRLINLL